jgi:hypothetical protein
MSPTTPAPVPSPATALVAGRLAETLHCPVCISVAVRPVTTPCGHTFCRGCLRSALQRAAARCPTCRTSLPGDPQALTVNFALWATIQALFPALAAAAPASPAPAATPAPPPRRSRLGPGGAGGRPFHPPRAAAAPPPTPLPDEAALSPPLELRMAGMTIAPTPPPAEGRSGGNSGASGSGSEYISSSGGHVRGGLSPLPPRGSAAARTLLARSGAPARARRAAAAAAAVESRLRPPPAYVRVVPGLFYSGAPSVCRRAAAPAAADENAPPPR